ncbi:transmembrane protein 170B-like [Montipora capricornis]|uniref:transmembrane protein 170B-like n=2 Tax=Montipora TaxID=46703 RepID=UPI0035F1469F
MIFFFTFLYFTSNEMDVQETLQSFGEMWYQIFLWCLATSVFIHCISACIAFLALRKHSRGFFFPLLVIFIGFLYPVTGGVITSATIAAVYETSRFTMPRYASFLWGAGQAFIGFLVSYTRVLATL